VIVQHGSARCPSGAVGHVLLPKHELVALLADADVVVVQGGPGGIMDSRAAGRLPIAVPRLARLGEVVDDHQVAFCRRMRDVGKVILAESELELRAALDRLLSDPAAAQVAAETGDTAASIQRFGELVDGLLAGRRGPRSDRNSVRRGDSTAHRPGRGRS
jgi:UDP-N-acetylglucosamine transferase subunit ALG13